MTNENETNTTPDYYRLTSVVKGGKKPTSIGMAQIKNEAEWDSIREVHWESLSAYINGEETRRKAEAIDTKMKELQEKRKELDGGN